ncbi:hypothetical protein CASFOL_030926 [Castilleja foliolosa]|uniref:Uncharacterized protein n=1 Tax=Castilleja foliolosa TaxID=1961234 RepID=A0ABD3C9R0_9LAMI
MATKSPPASTQQQKGDSSAKNSGLRKPVFVKVDALKSWTNGHTLVVKAESANTVFNKKPRNSTFRRPRRLITQKSLNV